MVDSFVLTSTQFNMEKTYLTKTHKQTLRKFQQDFLKQILLNVEGIESSFQGAFECYMWLQKNSHAIKQLLSSSFSDAFVFVFVLVL